MGYRFFSIKMDGVSLGVFAGDSPADAVLEMSADADPGAVHAFLAEELVNAGSPNFKRGYGTRGRGRISNPDEAATAFVALPQVEIEDLSSWPIDQLDALAREKYLADWHDFLLVQAAKSGYWASKSLARDMLARASAAGVVEASKGTSK